MGSSQSSVRCETPGRQGLASSGARQQALLASFSGIDGSGKSTQVAALHADLTAAGVRVSLLALWEDVAVWPRIREAASHTIFRGDSGTGAPGKPVNRRDKNVRSGYLTALRLFLYLLDAIHLRAVIARALSRDVDVIVFDRYIYDELANLPLENWAVRTYVRLLLRFVPTPDAAYLLDADPAQARERKPEYPLDFLMAHRKSYLALSQFVVGLKVIAPLPPLDVRHRVADHLRRRLPFHGQPVIACLQ